VAHELPDLERRKLMNEAEIRTLEQIIERLKVTALELTQQRTEPGLRIEEVERTVQAVVKLLPPEQRIDHHQRPEEAETQKSLALEISP
jgi:hypothetical protein